MTEIREANAIRNPIYLAGKVFARRDPVPVGVTPKRYEVKTPTSNLGLRIDRPFVAAGYPNVPQRFELAFTWATIVEPELLDHLGILLGIGQPFDVCLWKQVRDVFDGDGATQTFCLQRRQAITGVTLPSGVPATSFPDYATRVTLYSDPFGTPGATTAELTVDHKLNSTIDTGDPASGHAWVEDDGHLDGNRWVTKVRLGDAPADKPDILVVTYIPVIRIVVDVDSPRSYAEALREPRGFRGLEI